MAKVERTSSHATASPVVGLSITELVPIGMEACISERDTLWRKRISIVCAPMVPSDIIAVPSSVVCFSWKALAALAVML